MEEDGAQFAYFRKIIEGNGDGPGLKGKVDRLEQSEARRSHHIRALWAAVMVGAVEWTFRLFHSGVR